MKILDEQGFAIYMVGGGGMGVSHQTDAHTRVDMRLCDGARVKVGKLELEVLHSWGHSEDSICLFTSFGPHRILFSGDTVFAEGRHETVTADTDFKKYRAAIKRLLHYNATALLPGHKQFVLADGNEHIKLLDKKMSGRWADVMATRVPFCPTWWLEHNPALYDDAA